MASVASVWPASEEPPMQVNWVGLSGRRYVLVSEGGMDFHMAGDQVYVLEDAGVATWVGTADDIVADAGQRAAFRNASGPGTHAFRLDAQLTEDDRAIAAWDISRGRLATGPRLMELPARH